MQWRLTVLTVLTLVLGGCGSTSEPVSTSIVPEPADQSTSTTTSTLATGEPTVQTSTTGPVTTSMSATTVPEPVLTAPDLEVITQVTPTAGGGPRPDLAWEPVDGAVEYTVVVSDAEGAPWWAWFGGSTEVVLGGVDSSAEVGGPVAGPGVTWVVFAFGDDGILIGVSPTRPIQE